MSNEKIIKKNGVVQNHDVAAYQAMLAQRKKSKQIEHMQHAIEHLTKEIKLIKDDLRYLLEKTG